MPLLDENEWKRYLRWRFEDAQKEARTQLPDKDSNV